MSNVSVPFIITFCNSTERDWDIAFVVDQAHDYAHALFRDKYTDLIPMSYTSFFDLPAELRDLVYINLAQPTHGARTV